MMGRRVFEHGNFQKITLHQGHSLPVSFIFIVCNTKRTIEFTVLASSLPNDCPPLKSSVYWLHPIVKSKNINSCEIMKPLTLLGNSMSAMFEQTFIHGKALLFQMYSVFQQCILQSVCKPLGLYFVIHMVIGMAINALLIYGLYSPIRTVTWQMKMGESL